MNRATPQEAQTLATQPDLARGVSSVGVGKVGSLVLCGGGFLALYASTVSELVGVWASDPDFSHGFLVPAISAAILYANRDGLRKIAARPSGAGILVLAVSLVVFWVGHLSATKLFERLSLVGSLVGVVLFLWGSGVLRAQPFPFFFLLFAIPPPHPLVAPLRLALKRFATQAAADILALWRLPAMAEGNRLIVGEHVLGVADACTGIRSLIAIAATAVLFAYLFRAGVGGGLLLLATAIPVTVAVNVLRVVAVAVGLYSFNVDLARGTPHDLLGLAVFGFSVSFLYLSWLFYSWLFNWKERSVP